MKKITLILFLLLLIPSLLFSQGELLWEKVDDFSGGLCDDETTWELQPNEATDLLNIYVDEVVKGISKRKGFQKANTSVIGSSNPIRSLHRLKKSDGSEYMWAVSSSTIYGSTDGETFTSVKSGMSLVYDTNWANLMDSAYCVDGSTWAQKFTAYDSCTAATTVPRGRFLIEEGYRLWTAYPPGESSFLYHSALGNGADWSSDDAGWVYIAGEGKITGLGRLQGSVIVYKTDSVWKVTGIQVGEYFVPTIVNLSPNVGCVNHRSIQNFRLKDYTVQVFLGKDNVYVTNSVSVVPIGDKIKNTIEDLKQASFASSYSWIQTSAGDFGAGTSVNIDTTTVPGSMQLEVTDWLDTSTADFDLGLTTTNIDTSGNNIDLANQTSQVIDQQQTEMDAAANLQGDLAQSFKPSRDCYITKAVIYLSRIATTGESYVVRLKSDNDNWPGDILQTINISEGDVPLNVGAWITVNWTDQAVYQDHRYWIYVESMDTLHSWDYKNDNVYARGNAWSSESGHETGADMAFKIYESHWTNGTFESQQKTVPVNSVWGKFYETHLSGSGMTYTFKVRRYSTSWSSWQTVTNGQLITLTPGSKIQYYVYLVSEGINNPRVYDFTIKHVGGGTGNFLSQSHDCGTTITEWGSLVANHTLNGQTITYAVRTSSYTGGLTAGATWYSVISGNPITAPVNRYVQWTSTMSTTDGSKIPLVDDVTVNWWGGTFSGGSPTSVVYDDRYHLFAMTSGSDINDIDLVLNEDGAWVKHDIKALSAVIYNNKLYTGSSKLSPNGGYVYEQDFGNNDDGQAINSYWQSKDYTLGYPYKNKTLRKIWTVTKKSGEYPLTMTYAIDGGYITDSYDIWLSSGIVIVTDERHIGSEAMGKFFKFKVSNNGTNQPFELYRIDAAFQHAPGQSEP